MISDKIIGVWNKLWNCCREVDTETHISHCFETSHNCMLSRRKTMEPPSNPYILPSLGLASASCWPGSRYHLSAVDLFLKKIQPEGLPWPTYLGASSFHPQLRSWNKKGILHIIFYLWTLRRFPVHWQSNMVSWKITQENHHFEWVSTQLMAILQ